MMRKPGTSATREHILQFIRSFIGDRGYAPTVRDIVKGCNLSSTAVVQHHLNVLEREGQLLPAEELTNTLGQIIIPLRKALDQMPENIAGAVNPQDPARAETIMTQELHNIYADLVKSLKANEQTSEFRL